MRTAIIIDGNAFVRTGFLVGDKIAVKETYQETALTIRGISKACGSVG